MRFRVRSFILLPRAGGVMENVLETPSWHTARYGILATEFREASAPWISRPCIGLAPGAKGSPAFLPSGVEPVFLPYITLLVMVRAERVWMAFRYSGCFFSSAEK